MESLKLMYFGMPRSWYNENRKDYSISEERFNTLLQKLKNLPDKPILLYIQNACSIFVKELLDDYKIRGIDFVDYFKSVFENEKYELPQADIVVIYNVGIERALNTDFAARLLYGLIEQLKQQGTHIFLCSYLPYNEFFKKYNIEFVNKIVVGKKAEEKFI